MDVTCEKCRHEAVVNVDALPDDLPVPDVGLKLKCGACGSKRISTRLNMLEFYRHVEGVGPKPSG